jgi:hypothetical protein
MINQIIYSSHQMPIWTQRQDSTQVPKDTRASAQNYFSK